MYISPSGIRVCEGENRDGNPNIGTFFVVGGVEEYFSPGGGTRAPDIINMSGLVSAIVTECKEHHVTTRRVMVCSDCFNIETDINLEEGVGGIKNIMSGDISFGKKKKTNVPEVAPDSMVCKCSWGDIVRDGVACKVSSRSVGDKYMLKSLAQEFYQYGYEVIYISGTQEVLLNFRQTEPAGFDSQGKIIFDYDVACRTSILLKDIPLEFQSLPMLNKQELLERIMSQIKYALGITGRNPRIYLAGSVFSDTELYNMCLDHLEMEGYLVYDLFERPVKDDDYYQKVAMGEIRPILSADFSANVAMLMTSFAKTVVSLTPQLGLEESLKKNSKALATVFFGFSCVVLVASLVTGAIRFVKLNEARNNPSQLANLQSQMATLTARQQSLNSTIDTLTQADTTVLDLIGFVTDNQSDRVTVVSIDTRDMLTSAEEGYGMEVTTDSATVEEITGEAGGPGYIRENIIVRGYAKSGSEAVSYYNKLFNSGLMPTDPILNGVERYELPDGSEAYVFEIEIGGESYE